NTGTSLGDSVKRGAKDADEGVSALKENTAQNAKEMGASFQDVGSVLDGLQGLAAEALEGFGPAGIAAGVAMAAGIGIAQQALQASADKVNEIKESAAALAKDSSTQTTAERVQAIGEQLDDVLYTIRDVKSWWEIWQNTAVTAAEQVAAAADTGSTAASRFVEAFQTSDAREQVDALSDALAQSKRRQEDLTEADSAAWAAGDRWNQTREKQIDSEKTLQGVISDSLAVAQQQVAIEEAVAKAKGMTVDQYRSSRQAAQDAADAASSYASALESTADPVTVYTAILDRKNAAEQAAAEATAAATKDSTDSWKDYAADVAVSTQDLIDQWTAQAAQAEQFTANLAIIAAAGGQALADDLRAEGPEVGAAVADTIAKSGPAEQRTAIDAYARASGAAMGQATADGVRSQASVLQTAYDDLLASIKVGKVTVPVELTGDALEDMRRYVAAAQATAPSIRVPFSIYETRGNALP
ncbi:MAG: hypothetical protein L6311_05085, partial [Cellulomonas sp.]|nr:hypothetical protein [Cellulomonas sp.]